MAELGRSFEDQIQPIETENQVLRWAFKAGDLTQRDYQRKLKEHGKQLYRVRHQREKAEQAVGERFAAWMEVLCGRKVSLEEAERLLDAACGDRSRPAVNRVGA